MFQRSFAATGSLWPRAELRYVGGPLAAGPAFASLLEEFEHTLRSVPGPEASVLRSRLRGAASREDLWPLRGEMFELVSAGLEPWLVHTLRRDLEDLFARCRGRRAVG